MPKHILKSLLAWCPCRAKCGRCHDSMSFLKCHAAVNSCFLRIRRFFQPFPHPLRLWMFCLCALPKLVAFKLAASDLLLQFFQSLEHQVMDKHSQCASSQRPQRRPRELMVQPADCILQWIYRVHVPRTTATAAYPDLTMSLTSKQKDWPWYHLQFKVEGLSKVKREIIINIWLIDRALTSSVCRRIIYILYIQTIHTYILGLQLNM